VPPTAIDSPGELALHAMHESLELSLARRRRL